MAQKYQLSFSWLDELSNSNHDGTTQQIDDFAQAFLTENQVFIGKRSNVHQARLREDEVWLKTQRDPVVKHLEGANKLMDNYISGFHYIINGHACLPDDEPTKADAMACLQIMKDFKFRTTDAYGSESDKIIQMQQNLQPHQAFLTQIGAWTFFSKAVEQAYHVRQYLGERARTKGEFVKGEMKTARHATDQAIADLYVTIAAMMDLMPSQELTGLYNQLKGIELYARQYYLKEGHSGSGSGQGGSQGGGTNTGGDEGGDEGGGQQDGGDNGQGTTDNGQGTGDNGGSQGGDSGGSQGGGTDPVNPDPGTGGGGGADPNDPTNDED